MEKFCLHAILKLSRWQEFIPWTLPLTLLGGLMAYRFAEARLDERLLLILVANCLAVAYAFMINDIEDAPDDASGDPVRAARNAIAAGEISRRAGWLVALVTAAVAAGLFALGGKTVFAIGLVTIALAHLYSWKPVRLKALPLLDILSHVLFLSALLMLAPYFVYDHAPTLEVWMLVIAVTLISAYGQLYNQMRDYAADRAAGLKNTASVLGKKATEILGYSSVIVAMVCLAVPIIQGAFPYELILVVIAAIPIAHFFGRGRDMRGDTAQDAIGDVQVQFLLVANIVLVAWYVLVLLGVL